MKHLLITTIVAGVLVGCGPSVDIHQAVFDGDIQAVKQYLNASGDVNAKGEDGRTPLHLATAGDRKGIVELFIAKSADVNAKNKGGRTPLDSAIAFKHTETADLLRKHGGKTGEELKAEGK
jgi:ankyrin repeat protein